ncbi:MAG: glutamate--tRNA ligase family protein [Planctomycetota bacterium]
MPGDPVSDEPAPRPTTRLAPSPTGALHVGNARTFLVNWALAKQEGWRVLFRVEDLDTPRVKPGAVEATVEMLAWLGLTWHGDPTVQSADLSPYLVAMRRLAEAGLAYPSELTRREIEQAATAPQEGSAEARFPPELRAPVYPSTFSDDGTNWRFVVEPGETRFVDRFLGERSVSVFGSVGDFVVWTKRGQPSYQLAVTVDDARQGVTHVVRGNDLVGSTGRQMLLRRALGLGPEPEHVHLPLVRGPDGRRLAKRHGDTRLESYRAQGVPAERVIGLIAGTCGLSREPMTAAEFAAAFDLGTMPTEDVIFTPEDDAWLLGP